jgi:hypothetical protein
MCSAVLGTRSRLSAIAFKLCGSRPRLSRRSMAMARVTAGTARIRGDFEFGMIVSVQQRWRRNNDPE